MGISVKLRQKLCKLYGSGNPLTRKLKKRKKTYGERGFTKAFRNHPLFQQIQQKEPHLLDMSIEDLFY